jgi:hypothetical protein
MLIYKEQHLKMSTQDYVCMCTDDCVVDSYKNMMCALIARNKVLEMIANIKIDNNIENKCILIQNKVRIFQHNTRLKRLKQYLSVKIIQHYSRQFLQKRKKEYSYNLLKNCIKVKNCRHIFIKKRSAAIIIQYQFRKSFRNISYSGKCELIREIIYLKDMLAANLYIISDLKNKIKKTHQHNNRYYGKKWNRRNFLNQLDNDDTESVP